MKLICYNLFDDFSENNLIENNSHKKRSKLSLLLIKELQLSF